MEEQKRQFKGIWIPAEIWLDERLNALDKIIFAEIDSYSNSDKGCFAGNDYLASFCQCSESKVSKTISKLIDLGYVTCISFDGRKRHLQSCLVNFTRLDCKIYDADKQNLLHTNIDTNIYNNSINISPYNPPEGETEQLKELKPRDGSESEYCNMVASSYNSICKNLAKVQKITEKRKRAIKKAKKDIEEFGGWEKYFSCVASRPFLNGKNKEGWKADFDWLLKPDKITKITEGGYQYNNKIGNSDIPKEEDYDIENLWKSME